MGASNRAQAALAQQGHYQLIEALESVDEIGERIQHTVEIAVDSHVLDEIGDSLGAADQRKRVIDQRLIEGAA